MVFLTAAFVKHLTIDLFESCITPLYTLLKQEAFIELLYLSK